MLTPVLLLLLTPFPTATDGFVLSRCGNDLLRSTAALASAVPLRNAAMVNRTSFAPRLWDCPSGQALHPRAVTSISRRAFYTAHIHKVFVSEETPLWRALAGTDADNGGGTDGDSSVADARPRGELRLPNLKALLLAPFSRTRRHTSLLPTAEAALCFISTSARTSRI
jgi:hypothetical protein